ncbi:hypothetical protein RUM43_002419 [Polyplax serrata]|uniref:Uncharacterized protein n=1 Tax=Polyplax serrata TaxID=468196 RepID=A0AAN8NTC7_POLSC
MGKSTETQVNGTSPPFLMNLGVTRSIDCRQPLANSSYQHRSKIENNRKLSNVETNIHGISVCDDDDGDDDDDDLMATKRSLQLRVRDETLKILLLLRGGTRIKEKIDRSPGQKASG